MYKTLLPNRRLRNAAFCWADQFSNTVWLEEKSGFSLCIATVLMLMLNALKTSHCLPKLSQLDPKNPFTGFSSLKFPTICPLIVPHPRVPVMTTQCGTASHFTKARKVIFFLKIHLSLSSLVQCQNYLLASLHNNKSLWTTVTMQWYF